jgi:CDGSH-type Zn-finger protein/uncharacterized Fe-S cluster protein YjdI
MTAEPEIIVHNREQLIALLTEAAEIEHGLMCCYLYAAFSLKTGGDGGLSSAQLETTRRWRGIILDVAVEEMLHLGLVANLMTAIGATPHFSRPNFPVAPGYHPARVVVELAPFSKETIDHFVFLERPEGVDLADGAGFGQGRPYERATRPDVLVPSAQDFLTVGYLYRAIENGFGRLAREIGEAQLFIGQADAQITPPIGRFNELVAVTSLKTACAAIAAIVEQGEGSPGHVEDSHYVKFCGVRDELATLSAADPGFAPAWPVARNPVMRKPPTPEGKIHIDAPETARLLDLGNATYGLMLRCLMGAFGQAAASQPLRCALYDAAIDLMHAIVPVAEQLARLPATARSQTPTAGLTFTLPRSITPISDTRLLRIVAERADEVAEAASAILADNANLANVPGDLARIAMALTTATAAVPRAAGVVARGTADTSAQPAKTEPAPPRPASVEEVQGRDITIRFDGKRCIHARFCVLQAPTVFRANTPGAWIYPDAIDAERLVAVAEQCPSGAITYVRRDGRPAEQSPPVNVVRIRENGPYAVHGDIDLANCGRMTRATLCRCGASSNKPFCDDSHKAIGFVASGEPETRPSEPLAVRGGPLLVTPQTDGPLAVSGPVEVCAGTGRTIDRLASARLCRCGGSRNKPFCDGTHVRIGFRAP